MISYTWVSVADLQSVGSLTAVSEGGGGGLSAPVTAVCGAM